MARCSTLFCYKLHTPLTLKAKTMSSSRDGIAVGIGVYLLTRSTGSILACLLHGQRPFRKQTQHSGDIYSLTVLIRRLPNPGRWNKCLRFKPRLECVPNLFPIPSVLSLHMHAQCEHKLTLVLKEQRHTCENTSGWGLPLLSFSLASEAWPNLTPQVPSDLLASCTQLQDTQSLFFL